jgi:hypothetical protein
MEIKQTGTMKNFDEFSKGIKINESEIKFLNEDESNLEGLAGSIVTYLEDNDIDASYENEDGCLCIEIGGKKIEVKKSGDGFSVGLDGKEEKVATENDLFTWFSEYVGSHKAGEAEYKQDDK